MGQGVASSPRLHFVRFHSIQMTGRRPPGSPGPCRRHSTPRRQRRHPGEPARQGRARSWRSSAGEDATQVCERRTARVPCRHGADVPHGPGRPAGARLPAAADDGAGAADGAPAGASSASGPRTRGARGRWVRRLGDMLLIAGGLAPRLPVLVGRLRAGAAGPARRRLSDSSAAFAAAVVANADTRTHGVPDGGGRPAPRRSSTASASTPATRSAACGSPASTSTASCSRAPADAPASTPTATARCCATARCTTGSRRCRGPASRSPSPATARPTARRSTGSTSCARATRSSSTRPYARFRYAVVKTTVVLPTDVGVLADRGYAPGAHDLHAARTAPATG